MNKLVGPGKTFFGTAIRVAALLALPAGFGVAVGQESAPVTIDLAECAALDGDSRLACLGRQVDRQLPEPADDAQAPAEAERNAERPRQTRPALRSPSQVGEAAQSAPPPVADNSRSHQRRDGVADDDQAEQSEEMFGTIAALQETVPNAWLITLENGQVWRQTSAKKYPLQPGYEVRIYPSRWGSNYRLSSSVLNNFIPVERVR